MPTKALEMDVVHRRLDELGEKDAEGHPTLGGSKVEFHNGFVTCLWQGGETNRSSRSDTRLPAPCQIPWRRRRSDSGGWRISLTRTASRSFDGVLTRSL